MSINRHIYVYHPLNNKMFAQISFKIQAHKSNIQQAPSKINKMTPMPILINIAN